MKESVIQSKIKKRSFYRGVLATQDSINQELVKIQLIANTQKAFVPDCAVVDLGEFERQLYRVNSTISVKSLSDIKVENLTREVLDHYTIIYKALDILSKEHKNYLRNL